MAHDSHQHATGSGLSLQSPESGPERKRRRKVKSCYDCRRRKLQCDRGLPACGRCVRAGNATKCFYIEESNDGSSTGVTNSTPNITHHPTRDAIPPPQPPSDSFTRLEYQARRIRELEAALAHGQFVGKPPLSPQSTPERSTAVVDDGSVCIRGRDFKTVFSGFTHPTAMISQLSDLNQFTKEAFDTFPALQSMRNEIHALDDKLGIDDATSPHIRDEDLKAALPTRSEADQLVHLYIDTFDPVYHIIHLPTFWKAYDEMWTSPQAASTHFVALVLLMMATVSCLTRTQDNPLYQSTSSSTKTRAIRWIRYCEDWIASQSQKHVTSADFQIRALLWLAKHTSARKARRNWAEAGDFLRICMSAGLHRHPDLVPKETSQIDKELRRRIWATAVEFELQASFDRGMVSAPWLLQSDTNAPSNICDEDIDVKRPPVSRPSNEFTPSAYLALASDSLMLRSTLNAVLNNIRHTLSFDDVKHYTEEIELHLRNIPDWSDRRSAVPKALLDLRLRQYLLVLHDRHLQHATSIAERSFSKSILLETSLQMIEKHKTLIAAEQFALEVYCSDAVRVAVSMAHLQAFIDQKSDLAFSHTFDLVAPKILDDVVKMAKDKVFRYGREGRHLWITITCDGIVKATRHPEQRSYFIKQAVENVLSSINQVISSQEKRINDRPNEPGQSDVAHNDTGQLVPADPTLLDLDDLADWTLQDWFSIDDMTNLSSEVHGMLPFKM